MRSPRTLDFLVFSHLRWNFVYQRPQHLLARCAHRHGVWFWEEPVFGDYVQPRLRESTSQEGVHVLVPELPCGFPDPAAAQRGLLDELLARVGIDDCVAWYYTPMARPFTRHLRPKAVIYDCMDELSAFRGAPPGMRAAEAELFGVADLVFTGGLSLYHAKRKFHPSVHLFPSSIDSAHFLQARLHRRERSTRLQESPDVDTPADQMAIGFPRIGYCGVIDERIDLPLLVEIAELRPTWQFIMLGPVVKISREELPIASNLHYLGAKSYRELPSYMGGWDVAMLPFARNDSTRFISPTKTPEYLAAGCPVISTPIPDVVRPYGELGLVSIAATAKEFVEAAERLLNRDKGGTEIARLQKVDEFLAGSSWDLTWEDMQRLVLQAALAPNSRTRDLRVSANSDATKYERAAGPELSAAELALGGDDQRDC